MKTMKCGISLYETLNSGQCFRITNECDGSFTCILNDRVINIYEDGERLIFTSNNEEDLEEKIRDYFDLDTKYSKYYEALSFDNTMSSIVDKCKGYRLLRQDKFEMYISYIISQNNTVKNISNCINLLSEKFGKKITFNNKTYYLFPTFDEMKDATSDELKSCKVGFRDKYIINALNKIKDNPNFLNDIDALNTKDALNELMSVKGIGLKVASCILLFGYYKLDTFPIDTWVIKTISEKYNYVKPNQKDISEFAKKEFGELSGLAIQFMYHSSRNFK